MAKRRVDEMRLKLILDTGIFAAGELRKKYLVRKVQRRWRAFMARNKNKEDSEVNKLEESLDFM